MWIHSLFLLRTVLVFSSIKGLTHAYLVKTSLAHKKYVTRRFLKDNNPTSGKSAAPTLYLNIEYTSFYFEFINNWFA